MKFGLIYHLFFPNELGEKDMSSDLIPCGFQVTQDYVCHMVEQGKIIECDSTMNIVSQTGNSCIGRDWTIPLTPHMILRDQSLALDMVTKACLMAQEWGSEIIGLGIMFGKIGRRGRDVRKRVHVPLTNGDCFLIFNAVQVLMKLLELFEWEPREEKIAVYGFPSTIGTLLTEYLLTLGIDVTLIGKSTRYVQKLMEVISQKHDASLGLVPEISDAQKDSRIIFAAGSEDQKIDVHELDKPAVIIDVSFPRNVLNSNSLNALIIDAGVITMPKTFLRISGYQPDRAQSCLAELIVLSLEGKREDYSLGRNITLEKVKRIGTLAQRNGFELETLYSFGKPVKSKQVSSFKTLLNN